MKDFIAIDFETANANRASICSIGIVIVKNGEIAKTIYELVRPRPDFYSYWNTQVHGMTALDTASAPDFPEVWKSIEPFLEDLPMVAHNSTFDEGCLKAVFNIYEMEYPNYTFHCTCRAAKKAYRHLPNHKLNTVAEFCGFDLKNHHHALADAEAAAAIALQVFD